MSKAGVGILSLLMVWGLILAAYVPAASGQVQYLAVSRGEINLGMTTSITVTAPAAGTYTVVVVKPDGSEVGLNYSFTAAGQTQSANFGNSSLGYHTVVSLIGTYNVYLEQGGKILTATSFYATNKLNVWMDFVNGGLCDFVSGTTRGVKVFPRFYITYASNGAPLNKSSSVAVTYTLPDGSEANASYHAASKSAPFPYGFYIGKLYASWNYSSVGAWSPSVLINDGLGNVATYQYIGPAFSIEPAQLSTSVSLIDAKTSQPAAGFYNGQNVTIQATVAYPTNAEPVPGFVGLLNSTRGGTVTAVAGWGFYNSTTQSFGGTKNPGGLIAKVPLTYGASNGVWAGTFTVTNPTGIPSGAHYEVIVTSSDAASPPNTGFAMVSVPPANFAPSPPVVTTVTQSTTQTSTQTVTQSTTQTVTLTVTNAQPTNLVVSAPPAPASGQVSFSLALAAAVGTFIVGLAGGLLVKSARKPKQP